MQLSEAGAPSFSGPEGARVAPRPEIASVKDLEIPGPAGRIPIRVYRPAPQGELPVLVYFHGGGWAICSLETHDATCRQLANGALAELPLAARPVPLPEPHRSIHVRAAITPRNRREAPGLLVRQG